MTGSPRAIGGVRVRVVQEVVVGSSYQRPFGPPALKVLLQPVPVHVDKLHRSERRRMLTKGPERASIDLPQVGTVMVCRATRNVHLFTLTKH